MNKSDFLEEGRLSNQPLLYQALVLLFGDRLFSAESSLACFTCAGPVPADPAPLGWIHPASPSVPVYFCCDGCFEASNTAKAGGPMVEAVKTVTASMEGQRIRFDRLYNRIYKESLDFQANVWSRVAELSWVQDLWHAEAIKRWTIGWNRADAVLALEAFHAPGRVDLTT